MIKYAFGGKTLTCSAVDNTVETFKEVSDYIFLKIKESKK
jgi:hypothetical protein